MFDDFPSLGPLKMILPHILTIRTIFFNNSKEIYSDGVYLSAIPPN